MLGLYYVALELSSTENINHEDVISRGR